MQGEIRKINNPSDFALLAAEGYMFDCEERAGLSVFSPEVKYSERLSTYLEYDKHYGKYDFARLTSGIGTCPVFRKCLREYIKNFEPQEFPIYRGVKIELNSDGVFYLNGKSSENGGDTDAIVCRHRTPSGRQRAEDYDYLELISYLNVIDFWDEFEQIRNLNYVKSPIFFPDIGEKCFATIEALSHEALADRKIYINNKIEGYVTLRLT